MRQGKTQHRGPSEQLNATVAHEIAVEMNLLKARLGCLHLFKTMRQLDEATRSLGYELEDRSEIQR